jgi:hypothetical protein
MIAQDYRITTNGFSFRVQRRRLLKFLCFKIAWGWEPGGVSCCTLEDAEGYVRDSVKREERYENGPWVPVG